MEKVKRNILLNPGPATTTDSVKYAQVVPDICPREIEFGELMRSISHDLTAIVGNPEDYVTILFGGSGTAAVESMLTSVVGNNGKVLIINNGAYGKRQTQIADAFGLDYVEFNSSPLEPIDFDLLEKEISKYQDTLTHISMVHHETTSGLLNDISAVGSLCKKYGLKLIADTVSSYAGIPMDMRESNISFMASTSNKNIQGMAGICFVIANRSDLEELKSKPVSNFYLNLYKQYEYFEKTGQTRFTPPVQTMYALRQAIDEALEEGIDKRYERYTACWKILISGLEDIGLKYHVALENQSHLITTIQEPESEGYTFSDLHDYMIKKDFTIYPGKVGELNTFRIANIGDIQPEEMERFVDYLSEYMDRLD